jgi:hypothetical protein
VNCGCSIERREHDPKIADVSGCALIEAFLAQRYGRSCGTREWRGSRGNSADVAAREHRLALAGPAVRSGSGAGGPIVSVVDGDEVTGDRRDECPVIPGALGVPR